MIATAPVTAASITHRSPVLLTRDPAAVDAVQDVDGLPFTILAATPAQASAHWAAAPAVIVSADQVSAALAADLPARHIIVVVGDQPADLVAVAHLVTDHGGHRYRADVVPLALLAEALPAILARTSVNV